MALVCGSRHGPESWAHLERALALGFGAVPEGAGDRRRDDAALLAAFPLDRGRTDAETLAYAEDHDPANRGINEPPYEAFSADRMLVHRHMRLAFEAGATWLVELLETEREGVAAQVAYALEREAGLRPGGGR